MFWDTNPNAVSKQIQMSPTRKSKDWASRSGSERWYQWSAGPLWWHNIDLRSSSNDDIILIRDHTMINNDVILVSDHTMIIDQSWYWPRQVPRLTWEVQVGWWNWLVLTNIFSIAWKQLLPDAVVVTVNLTETLTLHWWQLGTSAGWPNNNDVDLSSDDNNHNLTY